MKYEQLKAGAYVSPTGSDLLWWLSKQLIEGVVVDRLILLPTQRSVRRLKRLLKDYPDVLALCEVKTYNDIDEEEVIEPHDTSLQFWKLVEDQDLMETLLKVRGPTFSQKAKFIQSVQSMMSELSFYGITPLEVKEKIDQGISPKLYQLVAALEKYSIHRDAQAERLISQCEKLMKQLNDIDRKVYLIIDGVVPPIVHHLAAKLIGDHIVLAAGQFTASQIPDIRFQQVSMYAPRRKLLFQMRQDVPKASELTKDIEGILCVEDSTALGLAQRIVKHIVSQFNDGEKVVSVVTGNRQISEFIVRFCALEDIAVDDSFGVSLDKSLYGDALLKGLAWLESPKDYKRLLTFIMLPIFETYWGKIPAKLDHFGREKQRGFKSALYALSGEDSLELKRIDELKDLYNLHEPPNFKERLNIVTHYIKAWMDKDNLSVDEGRFDDIALECSSVDQLRFRLQSSIERHITPKLPYVQILGPLEVRLLCPKNVIVVDMNEGEWPSPGRISPWLSSELRQDFNLSSRKTFIEASSHMFLSLMGCRRIVLGRTTAAEGQLTTSSRWWNRLRIVLKLSKQQLPLQPNGAAKAPKVERQKIVYKIPKHLRPTKLSVSDIHLWINDPEAFVMAKVFGAEPLAAWETEADHLQKGVWVHEVLEQGVRDEMEYPMLRQVALDKLNKLNVSSSDRLFWEVELDRYLHNFFELSKSIKPVRTWVEVRGEWRVKTNFGEVLVVGKADRIDQMEDGSLHIIDYKTGSLTSKRSVREGEYPQLLILGLMLKNGGFKEILEKKPPFIVSYWGLKSGESQSFLFEDLLNLESIIVGHIDRLLNPETVVEFST